MRYFYEKTLSLIILCAVLLVSCSVDGDASTSFTDTETDPVTESELGVYTPEIFTEPSIITEFISPLPFLPVDCVSTEFSSDFCFSETDFFYNHIIPDTAADADPDIGLYDGVFLMNESGETSRICHEGCSVDMHDSMDCPFCGVSNCFVDGFNVHYIRTSDRPEIASDGVAYLTESVCVFDFKNNRVRELCSFKSDNMSSSQCNVVYYDGYVYFYRQTPDPDIVEYTLWRVKANGGKEENMGLSLPSWSSLHYGDRMITSDINTIHISDMHGGERKFLLTLDKAGSITLWNCTDEGILTYTIDYGNVSELWEMNIENGKSKKLRATSDGIIKDICCFDDYVYFTVIAWKNSVDPNSAERAVDRYGNTAYKVTHNGKCTEHYTETNAVISNMKRCGNKIMMFTVGLGEDGKAVREKHPIER